MAASANASANASDLEERGVATIPVVLLEHLKRISEQFAGLPGGFPEFLPGATDYVMGGFKAFGNPSSFHNKLVRWLRQYAMAAAIPLLRELAKADPDLKLEQLVDRMMIRPSGVNVAAESVHRDGPKEGNSNSRVTLGGWINLNHDRSQYFRCVPGTHGHETATGFQKMSKEDAGKYASKLVDIEVPPGCLVLFHENIVHAVRGGKSTTPELRLFMGWRLTTEDTPLIPDIKTRLTQFQAVPMKSGQLPPLYAALHWTNWSKKIVEFARTVHPVYRVNRTVQSGKNEGKVLPVCERFWKGLVEAGLHPLPPIYTEDELEMHTPNTRWLLPVTQLGEEPVLGVVSLH